jgi:RNA polymerase sigma-70 factor (ECF subfamily)
VTGESLEDAFRTALDGDARPRFDRADALPAILAGLRAAAVAAYPDVDVAAAAFAAELARRLGATAGPETLARVRADHVHLAIACAAGDPAAVRRFESDFLAEVDAAASRLRARPDQVDEVRGRLRRTLFVSEPGRPAALREFSGRGDLRSYVRVIATRELIRVINQGRREVGVPEDAFLDILMPAADPELDYLRDHYRADVNAAVRTALAALPDQPRALLRYSVVNGWSVDRIGALYGVHRVTASRWVAAARDQLGAAIRSELASRLAISVDEVDSIVRLVQSRVDLSLERLLR